MGFASGKDGVFKIDDSGGVLRDISNRVVSVNFPQSADVHDVTVFGDDSRKFVPGLKNATFSVEGVFDGAAASVDEILQGIVGKEGSFEYGPQGGTAGLPKYTGECIVTEYGASTPVDDKVSFSLSVQVTGDVTRSTYA